MHILTPHIIFLIQIIGVGLAAQCMPFALIAALFYVGGLAYSRKAGTGVSKKLESVLAILLVAGSFLLCAVRGEHYTGVFQYWLIAMLVLRSYRKLEKRDYMFCFLISATLFLHIGRLYSDLPFLFITLANLFLLPYALFQFLVCYGGFQKGDSVKSPCKVPFTFKQFRFMTTVTLIMIVIVTGLFLVLPRPSNASVMSQLTGRPEARTGFSDNVSLGTFNSVVTRRDVVMAVTTDKPAMWRCGVLDYYENGTWEAVAREFWQRRQRQVRITDGAQRRMRRFKVYDLHMTRHHLFSDGNIVSARSMRYYGIIRHNPFYSVLSVNRYAMPENSMEYELLSIDSEFIGPVNLGNNSFSVPDNSGRTISEKDLFLQLPDAISGKVRKLAADLTRGKDTIDAKARAVSDYLEKNCKYTMRGLSSGRKEPTDYFLFDSKEGHCEYFASAMAIMLRCSGVRARVVQGFREGIQMDEQYVVRLSDAHLWVEVFYPGKGWKSYDPTPPSDEAISFRRHVGIFEKMKMKWYVHVIQYDASSQSAVTAFIIKMVIRVWNWFVEHVLKNVYVGIALIMAVVIAVLYKLRLIPRIKLPGWSFGDRRKRKIAWVRNSFGRYLKEVERKGYKRVPSTTPNDLLAAMERDEVSYIEDARMITQLFYSSRFGGSELTQDERIQIKHAMRRIAKS